MPTRVVVIEDDTNARRNWKTAAKRLEIECYAPDASGVDAFFDQVIEYIDKVGAVEITILDLNLFGNANGGKELWGRLHEAKGGGLGKLLVSSQRVDGEALDEFVTRWDAEYTSAFDLVRKQEKLSDVISRL